MKYAGQSKAAAIQKGSFCILIAFRFLFIGHLSIEHPQKSGSMHGASRCSSIESMDALSR